MLLYNLCRIVCLSSVDKTSRNPSDVTLVISPETLNYADSFETGVTLVSSEFVGMKSFLTGIGYPNNDMFVWKLIVARKSKGPTIVYM